MSRPLLHVKRETRILGLDCCNPRLTVGVVIRGGLYLDGVMVFARKGKGETESLAKEVTETRYFPELRSIMLHDPRGLLDPRTVQRVTQLPLIAVSHNGQGLDRGYRLHGRDQYQLWIKTELESTALHKILSLTHLARGLPEPLRIAHLLAKLNILRSIPRDKE